MWPVVARPSTPTTGQSRLLLRRLRARRVRPSCTSMHTPHQLRNARSARRCARRPAPDLTVLHGVAQLKEAVEAQGREVVDRETVVSQLTITAHAIWLASELDKLGIEFVVVKGPWLAELWRLDGRHRSFGDIDVLARADSLPILDDHLRRTGATYADDPGLLPAGVRTYFLRQGP